MTLDQPSRPQRYAVLIRLAQAAVLAFVLLALLDAALRIALPRTQWLNKPVDIQSANMLSVKLDALRRFDGIKVVVMGDSLAYGHAMQEHGDADWQNHTLSVQLQAQLEKAYPGKKIMVANLGMNGLLPADLNQLMRIVRSVDPDLVIFDVTLRSFSREFDKDNARMSRFWLKSATGGVQTLADHWYLYRLKDTLQALAFDGQPSGFVVRWRDKADLWLKGTPPVQPDEMILLLKAGARYSEIDLAADNPQRIAMEQTLAALNAAGQPAIAFYATENKDKLDDLIDPVRYKALQAQLKAMMTKETKTVQWVGPLNIYASTDYLDHVHLNQDGYSRLIQRLLPLVRQALSSRQEVQ